MTLEEYLKRPGSETLTDFAAAIGISKGRLSQLKKPGEVWPPDLAMKAENKSGGALDAAQLSPVIAQARDQRDHAA